MTEKKCKNCTHQILVPLGDCEVRWTKEKVLAILADEASKKRAKAGYFFMPHLKNRIEEEI